MNSEEIIDRGEQNNDKNYFILSKVKNFVKKDNILHLELDEGKVALEFITAKIVRVIMAKRDDELDFSRSVAVVEYGCSYDNFRIEDTGDKLEVRTDSLVIMINKVKFGLIFYDLAGNLLHKDNEDRSLGWSGNEVRAWKEFREEERIYGLGEKTGLLDKRGRDYTMWNTDTFDPHVPSTDPLYQSIPFFIGFNLGTAYGIYFDNSYESHFDLGVGGDNYYSFYAQGGKLDYYFIGGGNIKEVLSDYTFLTGRMPLPPKWALGYHQSRYSYHPDTEVKEIAETLRKREIPCDAIHLDIHYMDDYKIFTWNEEDFSDPEEMINDLAQEGFKIVTIIDPGVKNDPSYHVYQEGIKNDYFCKYLDGGLFTGKVWPGDCVFPDFTKEEVRDWWGDLNGLLVEQGVRGIWNDMNEPAVFEVDSFTMDLDVYHENDGDWGTQRRFHNLYGLLEDKATYEGLKRNLSGERPFVLTRAGFAGIQRYSAVWTGDNRSFWQHLKLAMPMLMNLGLSGVAFCGTDVGGFADNSNGELLVRWSQLGVFVPFFRNHCSVTNINQEPWSFGEEYEVIIREYIKLRYKFLTYLYNLFYQSSQTGLPVMRPLVLEYPNDKKTYNLSDQFMLGEDLLVAPVCQPDKDERMVYLPQGNWYDFWTGQQYQGGRSIIVEAPLDKLPLFIKGGSIIPFNQAMNYVGEKQIEELEVNIYFDKNIDSNSYLLYEDDGLSFAYQDGEYNLTEFSYEYNNSQFKLMISKKKVDYESEYSLYSLRINNLTISPKEVRVAGQEITNWDYNGTELSFKVDAQLEELDIMIRL